MMIRTRTVKGKAEDLEFLVREESFGNGEYRTLSIEGAIRKIPGRAMHKGRRRSEFDHHGHLISDLFGGPGSAESGNIVAMHGHANNGAGGLYRAMELAVEKLIGNRTAWMKVDVQYLMPSDFRPHSFQVQVQFSNGMYSRWTIFNFYPFLPNPYRSAPS